MQNRRFPQEDGTAFRDRAPTETVSYLLEVQGVLGKEQNPEQRRLLVGNVFDGLTELDKVAVDATCTRVLESLAPEAGVETLVNCLSKLNQGDRLYDIACNPFGSHLIEALLKSLSDKPEEQCFEVIDSIVQYVAKYMADFLPDRFATYVVRRLLALLSGRDVVKMCKEQQFHNKGRRSFDTPSSPIVFPSLLEHLVGSICKDELQGAAMDMIINQSVSGATLQAALLACAGSRELVKNLVWALLGFEVDGAVVQHRMKSRSGSHVMEVIFHTTPKDIISLIVKELEGDMLNLALHPSANFALKALIAAASCSEQMDVILAELGPYFGTLLKKNRGFVVQSVLAACLRLNCGMKEACKYLSEALQTGNFQDDANHEEGRRAGIVETALCMGTSTILGKTGGGKLSPMGCATLCIVLGFPQTCNNAFVGGIARLNSASIQHLAKDPGGCHVLEAIIENDAKTQIKNQVLNHLRGTWGQIVRNPSGIHLAEKCFQYGALPQKEAIAEAASKCVKDLSSTVSGKFLLQNLRISEFTGNRNAWKKQVTRQKKTKDNFLKEMEVGLDFDPGAFKSQVKIVPVDMTSTQDGGDKVEEDPCEGSPKKKKKKRKLANSDEKVEVDASCPGVRSASGELTEGLEVEKTLERQKKKKRKKKRKTLDIKT